MENWRKNLYLCWLSQLLCILGFNAANPFIPYYLQDLGVTDPNQLEMWTGWIATGGAVSMAIFAPIWGSLADRHGRKIMVERAAFGGALAIALIAFTQTPGQLLVLRTLQGIFTGTVAAFTTLVACSTPRREIGFALGLMQMAVYSGSSGGPVIGGFLADAFGYRSTFLICSLMLLAGGLIAWRLVKEHFVPAKEQKREGVWQQTREILGNRAILIMTIVLFSLSFTSSMVRPLLPLFIMDLQASQERLATVAGLVQGASAFSSAIAAAFIGKISDRLGHRRVLIICCLGAALFYLPQTFVSSSLQFVLFDVIVGIFLGGLMPSANAVIALNIDPGKQGATYGMTASAGAAARAVGPLIGSTVAISRDIRTLFPMATVLYVMIGAWIALALKRGPSEVERPRKAVE